MAGDDTTTYRVELRFLPVGACDPTVLEAMSVDVLEAMDEYTPEAVLGAAASVGYDPPSLDIDVEVAADTVAELHRVLAETFQVLEDHAGMSGIVAASSFTEKAGPKAELVPA